MPLGKKANNEKRNLIDWLKMKFYFCFFPELHFFSVFFLLWFMWLTDFLMGWDKKTWSKSLEDWSKIIFVFINIFIQSLLLLKKEKLICMGTYCLKYIIVWYFKYVSIITLIYVYVILYFMYYIHYTKHAWYGPK